MTDLKKLQRVFDEIGIRYQKWSSIEVSAEKGTTLIIEESTSVSRSTFDPSDFYIEFHFDDEGKWIPYPTMKGDV